MWRSLAEFSAKHSYLPKILLDFLSHLGYEICNVERKACGTMSLYLRLGDSDSFYSLTCRHVVLEMGSSQSDNIDVSSHKAHLVEQLGLERFVKREHALQEALRLKEQERQRLEHKKNIGSSIVQRRRWHKQRSHRDLQNKIEIIFPSWRTLLKRPRKFSAWCNGLHVLV